MRRSTAVIVVAIAAAAPRLVVLSLERGTILQEFVEKSDRFAQTLVANGTFGFLAGVPSAYTQPLYAFFLAGVYWPFGHAWLAVGLVQTAVAVGTALLVLEIGRRVGSLRVGLIAALLTTLHPYVVWHDVHVNREILDSFLLALLTLLIVVAWGRRSTWRAAAVGATAGLAILGNSRLLLLAPLVAVLVVWPLRPRGPALVAGLAVVAAAAVVVAPWVIRNQANVGCATITTDARALWKANNGHTYDVLAAGKWIDDVPERPGAAPWPELAADLTLEGKPTAVDECAQMLYYRDAVLDFWRHHPAEKAKLAGQAVMMLWQPTFTVATGESAGGTAAELGRRLIEPGYMLVLYALAIVGGFLAPRRFRALVIGFLAYNTLMAMVFAGTVRYRVPWDFLLALLAAFAIERGWVRWRERWRYDRAARASAAS